MCSRVRHVGITDYRKLKLRHCDFLQFHYSYYVSLIKIDTLVQSLNGVHTNTEYDNLKRIPFSFCQNRIGYASYVLQTQRTRV